MCARNPKESDTDKQLVEVFTKNESITPSEKNPEQNNFNQEENDKNAISARISQDIGFHFHTALPMETEAHQDCVCALAKLIGHTEQSFSNYEQVISLWNIVKNISIGD
jgi:hypothetical protein